MFKAHFKGRAVKPSAAPPRESARIEIDTEGSPHIQAVAKRASQLCLHRRRCHNSHKFARYLPRICPIAVAFLVLIGINNRLMASPNNGGGRGRAEDMTATDQTPMNSSHMTPARGLYAMAEALPLVLTFRPNYHLRSIVMRVVGAAMVLSSTGIWLMPGAAYDPEMALIKIGISVFFLFAGMALMMINDPDGHPDAYFDPIRRELRVLQRSGKGRPRTVLRRGYDSLGSVRFKDRSVELFEIDGTLLIRLPINLGSTRQLLRECVERKVKS